MSYFFPNNSTNYASYDQNMAYRTAQLNKFGEMMIDGNLIHKIDHIGSVYLTSGNTFNVYRRYNSEYNIVLEDSHYNYLVQRDMTIRESIGCALYLSEEEQQSIQCIQAASVKHNTVIPDPALCSLKWSEVQEIYTGITIQIGYKPDDQQSQVNEVINDLNYDNLNENDDEYIAPIPEETSLAQAPQQTPAFRLAKKRRRSELELLEPLPYNLRNKKQKM